MGGGRLVRVARAVEGAIEPIAGAVAGEDAAGAVAAVRRGRQSDDQQPRRRIAEPRHRASPVYLVLVGRPLVVRDLLAPRHKARAQPARDDLLLQFLQRLLRRACCFLNHNVPSISCTARPKTNGRTGWSAVSRTAPISGCVSQ